MSRIVGVRDLHIAKLVSDGVEGTEYATPVRVPSLVSVDITDNSESTSFYSDDVVEQTIVNASSTEVEIKVGYLDNKTAALLTGQEYDETTGALYQSSNATAPELAIMFRAPKSKGGFAYLTLFKGVLSLDGASFATQEEGVESQGITLKGVFSPLTSNGRMRMRMDSDFTGSSATVAKWFTEVQGVDAPAKVLKASK